MKEITKQRWKEAQEYEKKYWEKHIETNSLRFLERSKKIKSKIKNYIGLNKKNKILQVGCGPEDVIHYWKEGDLYAIDPQMINYKKLGILRGNGVKNIQGMGEKLPFQDNFFDLIIINNVLDHCQEPKKVLEEINRCLKKEGILYTETNVRPIYLFPFLKLIWWTKILTARGHPYLFLPNTLRKLIETCNFEILSKWSNKQKFKLEDLKSLRKFAQYITEYQYACICKKAIKRGK